MPLSIRVKPGDMERGIDFSTFSIIGRCERTSMFGIAIATSEMAVGSRCIHVAHRGWER